MVHGWSTFGLDLHLTPSGPRVRAGLESALRDAIRGGRLAADIRLPSTRALAADLGIARGTVADAYGQLVAEGWLVARGGSGTWVARRPPGPASRSAPPRTATAPRYDLRPGSPDLAAFPRAAWISASRRALAGASADALGYREAHGRPELRAALAEYLARARGVHADPERIVVCAGFSQGLELLCGVLQDRGARSLAAEAYGLGDHRRIVARAGLVVETLGVDDAGARVDELGDCDAALLTAAHQFPLGGALAPERRAATIQWATSRDAIVIEDDYDGEFRYDRQPVGAMQALAPDRVVYGGTASKSLAPGLRIGWLVLPAELVEPIAAAQALVRGGPSAIDQLTLAELIMSGAYDRHVRRARLVYRARRDRLVVTVQRAAPRVRVLGIAAGLHAVLALPDGCSAQRIVSLAADRGLALESLGAYAHSHDDAPPEAALVIGYGTPPEHAYTASLARLAAALEAVAER